MTNDLQTDNNIIDAETSIFLSKWIENGFNGARAYAEIHKDITYESACVGASRVLRKVNISSILEIRSLGCERFFAQMEQGISAEQIDKSGKVVPDHKTRYLYWMTLGKLLGLFVNQETPDNNKDSIWAALKAKYTINT